MTQITEFGAKFKIMVSKDNQTSQLDFLVEDAFMPQAAVLLKLRGSSFELKIDGDGVSVSAMLGYAKFNGDGRTYLRLIADTRDSMNALQAKLDRDVHLEVSVK